MEMKKVVSIRGSEKSMTRIQSRNIAKQLKDSCWETESVSTGIKAFIASLTSLPACLSAHVRKRVTLKSR